MEKENKTNESIEVEEEIVEVEDDSPVTKKSSFFSRIATNIQAYFKPTDIQKDILRYKSNTLARSFCFLAIICNCLAFLFVYSTMTKVSYLTGIDIVYNILFMLFTFLTAEKIKVYNKNSSYAAFGLGLLEIAHYFWYILIIYTQEGSIEAWVNFADLILMMVSGGLLIVAAVANYFRSSILENYLNTLAETDATAKLDLLSKKGGK